MSPDAVWLYGCAAKSAEPVSIQAPHRRAARSHEGKGGPERAAEATRRLITTSAADSVGDCLPSRPLTGRLSPSDDNLTVGAKAAAESFSR